MKVEICIHKRAVNFLVYSPFILIYLYPEIKSLGSCLFIYVTIEGI